MMKASVVYSFDVFDTLITRKTATPLGVFAYMQKKLQEEKNYFGIHSFIRGNFYELRIGAESVARKYFYSKEIQDVTLEQIYDVMGRTSCLTEVDKNMLATLERETEIELSVGIDSNIDYLRKLHEQGEKIVLISDMYLDSATIRRMLVKADPVFENIPLYVSSEIMKTKGFGDLYSYVMEKEKISAEEWVHVGDNQHSDVSVPEKMGIIVRPVKEKTLLPCEEAAIKVRESDACVQFAIGASANARLFSPNIDAAYRYGTSLGGNIAYSYVCWLIHRSLELGIKRLYFIARDGYLLKEIADSIIVKNQYDIRTFYIYGSRKAWRMAALSEKHFDISLMLQWDTIIKNRRIDKLAEAFEIEEDTLRTFLTDKYKDRDEAVSAEEFNEIVDVLENNSVFRNFILKQQEEKHALLRQYLEQNVDVSDNKFAFVELIGSGYTQRSLSYVMEEICAYPVRTFFYQLDAQMDTDNCKYYCYMPAIMRDGGIMELFYSAPHGHTVGYHMTEEWIVEPILDKENEALLEYGLKDYILGMQEFLKEYGKAADLIKDESENPDLSLFYRRYLAGNLDDDLLTYIGDMPYKANGTEGIAVKYAPVLTEEILRLLCVRGGYEKAMSLYMGLNLELSKKRSNQELWNRLRKIYGFPIEKLKKRIAIYGAGKFGKALYEEIGMIADKEVVLWVDKNYEELSNQIPQLSPIEKIGNVECEQIVIAILNLGIANEVKEELVRRGIEEEKIMTYEVAFR